jgi:hypothetical protein
MSVSVKKEVVNDVKGGPLDRFALFVSSDTTKPVPKKEDTDEPLPGRVTKPPNMVRNHPAGKATIQECLAVLNGSDSIENQRKMLESRLWRKQDVACMMSLRISVAWSPLTELLNEPFYADTSCGTVVDWAIEYLSYPVSELLRICHSLTVAISPMQTRCFSWYFRICFNSRNKYAR